MILDLSDPESIRAWLAVRPGLHEELLRIWMRNYPQFAEAIAKALEPKK